MAVQGERRLQILQTLAGMLEAPEAEKITTAALAARLQVSEAALYRHFASKAQMYDGLIEFIEQSLFGLINRIVAGQDDDQRKLEALLAVLLGFAGKNPGMTRVLTGDALVHENVRLQASINQMLDRIEATLRQVLRIAAVQGDATADPAAAANLLLCHVIGRWQLFVRSGFRRSPDQDFALQWPMLSRACCGRNGA